MRSVSYKTRTHSCECAIAPKRHVAQSVALYSSHGSYDAVRHSICAFVNEAQVCLQKCLCACRCLYFCLCLCLCLCISCFLSLSVFFWGYRMHTRMNNTKTCIRQVAIDAKSMQMRKLGLRAEGGEGEEQLSDMNLAVELCAECVEINMHVSMCCTNLHAGTQICTRVYKSACAYIAHACELSVCIRISLQTLYCYTILLSLLAKRLEIILLQLLAERLETCMHASTLYTYFCAYVRTHTELHTRIYCVRVGTTFVRSDIFTCIVRIEFFSD